MYDAKLICQWIIDNMKRYNAENELQLQIAYYVTHGHYIDYDNILSNIEGGKKK